MKLGEASGISAGLQSQYNEIKGIRKDGRLRILNTFLGARVWIWGATAFTLIALSIGLWVGLVDGDLKPNILVSRTLIIFISLSGAWFCAGQYVKTSNIASDYAYKVSLAKSIVAFSDQLKVKNSDDASYKEYMKKVLDEIHQHPLRSYKK